MQRYALSLVLTLICVSNLLAQVQPFDVTRYGAIANDATSDDTAIDNAILAAEAFTAANPRAGAVIEIPRGTYIVTSLSVSGDRITINGNGATLTKDANGSETQLLIFTSDSEDCEVNDLKLDGIYPTYDSSGTGDGLSLSGTRTTCRNVRSVNMSGAGIVDGTTGWGNRLYECYVSNLASNAYRSSGDWFEIHDCEMVDWDAAEGGNSGVLCASRSYDGDSLLIDGLRIRQTVQRDLMKGILIDSGDNAADGASTATIAVGNGGAGVGAAVNSRGKAQWTIDRGHGIEVGDGFLLDDSGQLQYDGEKSLGISHKVIRVTGHVYVRSTGAATFTLHDTALGAANNTGTVDLSSSVGVGTFYVKCPGQPRRSVTCSTGVDLGTDVITTDATHNFRTGSEARLTIAAGATDSLPGGLDDSATITVNTDYTVAGTAAKYTRQKRYVNVTIKGLRYDYYPGDTDQSSCIKIANVENLLMDDCHISHAAQVTASDNATLQLAGIRKAVIQNSQLGGFVRNNIRSWLNDITFRDCTIGGDDYYPSYAIEQVQCGRLTVEDCRLRFITAGLSVPLDTDSTDFRDADCEYINLKDNRFEAFNTGRGRIFYVDDVSHLAHAGIIHAYGNSRKNIHPSFTGLTFTAPASPATTDIIDTSSGHALVTGDEVTLSTSGSFPPATPTLTATDKYYVRRVDATTLTLHTSKWGATSNTDKVEITDAGTGPHVLFGDNVGCQLSGAGPRDTSFLQRYGTGADFIAVSIPSNASFLHNAGDTIWNMNPDNNSPLGWMCIESGEDSVSPGTFTIIPQNDKNYESLAANDSLTIEDSGKVFSVDAADLVISLPKVTSASGNGSGIVYTFVLRTAGLSAGTGLSLSPNAADEFFGNGFTAAVNKDCILAGSGDRDGDAITIMSDATRGWAILSVTGTWTRE